MKSYVPHHPSTALMFRIGCFMYDAARALWRLSERLDAWIAARAKASDDGRALSEMSEYELRDIGVSRTGSLVVYDRGFFHAHDDARRGGRIELGTIVWP